MAKKNKFDIRLMENSISKEELKEIKKCLKSGKYTQGPLVDKFEKSFAKWNGSKYAVMVNSGSSANLLMVAALKEKYKLRKGDEVLVPMVTWPTTIFPVIQNGLKPVFCDVGTDFNISLKSLKKMSRKKTKAIFVVHLLGQPAKMNQIIGFCKRKNILIIEDCCESQGGKVGGIKVGNFGIMGSFSLYFGHHMTTIEGGVITTNDFELYDKLKSFRSHGWIKGTNRENLYPRFKNKSFVFDIPGYNLRNNDLNASIGNAQIKKIDGFIKQRLENHSYFLEKIKGIQAIPQKVNLEETSSFCLALIFKDKKIREYILENLPKKGIECRPVVAGNLLKQPVFEKTKFRKDFQNISNIIHHRGIYLPNNQFVGKKEVDYMVETISKLLKKF
jgi:CDP-4-dehydro-6-deoxyglucose reductase, E1